MRSSRGAVAEPPETDRSDVVEFIETFCRLSKGGRAGETVELLRWQQDLLTDTFVEGHDGRRKHRTALWGLPRKNSKSFLGSGVALYLLVADGEPGAEVYSCAGDKQQAKIVFGEARRMVEADEDPSSILTVYRDAIEYPRTQSVYRVLTADAKLQQGLNPSACIFDEVHVQPNEDLWNALVLGMGTRAQPLMLGITTAGYDDESLLYRLYTYGKRVQSGEVDDPQFFFRWWEPLEADCDWRDPAVWAECNPALGHFLHEEALEADARTTPEHEFRRYHLNQWTSARTAWLPYGAWDACKDESLTLDPSLPTFAGVDIALRNDSTAVVLAQRQGERTVVRARVWENPYQDGHHLHDSWELNIFEVETYLREVREQFPAASTEIDGEVKPGPEFNYDPAYFHRSAQVLRGDGLAMNEIPQSDQRMIPASQNLYQLVVEGKLAHDGDPTLKRHIENAVADQKPRGWRLTKPKGSRRKIDAAIACAIAAFRAQSEPPQVRRSVYEERGILSF
jgi:phage terminase large subunit-like protein